MTDVILRERIFGGHPPKAVNGKKITASYENGVLEITLPKAPEAKPKKVEITVK